MSAIAKSSSRHCVDPMWTALVQLAVAQPERRPFGSHREHRGKVVQCGKVTT
jgi:hypothetical protein